MKTLTKGTSSRPPFGLALAIALSFGAGAFGAATAAETFGATKGLSNEVGAASGEINPVVVANDILNRWEPVAIEAGIHTSAWREIFATQLTRMHISVLRQLDSINVRGDTAKSDYAQFERGVRNALMQAYVQGTSGKGHIKLGSTTTDQVFIPITPCRVVDSRNLLGPILAGFPRNYQFYASSASVNFGTTQGGQRVQRELFARVP